MSQAMADTVKTVAGQVSNFTMNSLPKVDAVKAGAYHAANFTISSLPSTNNIKTAAYIATNFTKNSLPTIDAVKTGALQAAKFTVNTMPTTDTLKTAAHQASNFAVNHARKHPYYMTFNIVGMALTPFLGSGWVYKPVLNLIGFGAGGPIAGMQISIQILMAITDPSLGTLATWYQSSFLANYIAPGSLFAMAQHLRMAA